MRVHSVEKISKVKTLRRGGYSINEIVSELSIPKTTVWHHIQSVEVLPEKLLSLKSRRGGSRKRFLERVKLAQKDAKDLLAGPNREKVIILAMLYWAEGQKKKRCDFINSDGSMISLYLKILRDAFKVPDESIRPEMRIFTGMNREECLSYWSKLTELPKDNFKIRFNDGGTRGRTRYGMCRITVKKGSQHLKLFHALINQIKKEIQNLPS